MKNLLEYFLDEIEVRYTKQFARNLYNEHPHKHNMLGLKMMLEVYGIKTLGVRIAVKDLSAVSFPCIMHTGGDFAIGLGYEDDHVTYIQHGKKITLPRDSFKMAWSGNALVVEETTEAEEPDYASHKREERLSKVKAAGIPLILAAVVAVGLASNLKSFTPSQIGMIFLNITGVLICMLLMYKQLSGGSGIGDRVCSLFSHSGCNDVLDSAASKVFGISWSEIGLGYFSAGVLAMATHPAYTGITTAINCAAMLFGIWSLHYQWRVARSWCALCVASQAIIWTIGIMGIISYKPTAVTVDAAGAVVVCSVYAVSILAAHALSNTRRLEAERAGAFQRIKALKANSAVAKALIENSGYVHISDSDSSILFGNPDADMRVTILSNPHCNPCAKMHSEVERLLKASGECICIQYIFTSFNKKLEDSCRYLISCYKNNPTITAFKILSEWYTKDKYKPEGIYARNKNAMVSASVNEEMQRHRKWVMTSGLSSTPTVLVNGHILPNIYGLEDLSMIAGSLTIN